MKIKITLVLIAVIALTSFNSCSLRIGGRGGRGHEHQERGHSYVQPLNNGLQNSFAAPVPHQPKTLLD